MALNHRRPDLGVMLNPGGGAGIGRAPLKFVSWAADVGMQSADIDIGDYIEWLASLRAYRARCLFVVAPDVLADPVATWERSLPYLPTIRQLGYPVAFVTQDGCNRDLVPWDEIDCLFVGGSDEWKLSEPSYALVREAKQRGLRAHMGRVNSFQRLKAAHISLFDSADGTFVRHGPDRRLPEVFDWLDALRRQQHMEIVA